MLEHGGGLSFHGGFVQRSWTSSDLADDPSINLLETRAACESVMALSEPGDRIRLHIDNRTAAAYIRCQGGTRSNVLSQEALLLWEQGCYSPSSSVVSYRREHSSRLPFKA